MFSKGEKRNKMFIQKEDQILLMIRAFIHIAMFSLLLMIVIYAPGEHFFKLSETQQVTNSFIYYHIDKAIWIPLIFVLIGFITIIGSHRIVGPVVRFKSALRSALEKDLTHRVQLRNGDHFTELAELLQDELVLFSNELSHFRQKSEEALERLESMENVAGREEAIKAISEIQTAASAYKLIDQAEQTPETEEEEKETNPPD